MVNLLHTGESGNTQTHTHSVYAVFQRSAGLCPITGRRGVIMVMSIIYKELREIPRQVHGVVERFWSNFPLQSQLSPKILPLCIIKSTETTLFTGSDCGPCTTWHHPTQSLWWKKIALSLFFFWRRPVCSPRGTVHVTRSAARWNCLSRKTVPAINLSNWHIPATWPLWHQFGGRHRLLFLSPLWL